MTEGKHNRNSPRFPSEVSGPDFPNEHTGIKSKTEVISAGQNRVKKNSEEPTSTDRLDTGEIFENLSRRIASRKEETSSGTLSEFDLKPNASLSSIRKTVTRSRLAISMI